MRFRNALSIGLLAVSCGTLTAAPPGGSGKWVLGTWATALYPNRDTTPNGGRRPEMSPEGMGPVASSAETLRQIVHISLGGEAVRVVLSNEYGAAPLTVSAASVAVSAGTGDAKSDSVRPILFGGKTAIVIPNGAVAVSDPVDLKVEPLTDLAVSLYLPAQAVPIATEHGNAVQTSYRAPGDVTAQAQVAGASPFAQYFFLKEVQVMAPASAGAIVAFGDSITDGAYVTPNSNMRWPDELARRLQADKHTRNLSVLNEGIGGNRVLHDGTGPSALARLGTDALDLPGVRYIILLEAINDIGHAYQPNNPYDVVTADDLIQGYQQIIARAHEHGIKVIGATLTPYVGAGYASPAGEKVREAVNDWVRGSGHFDGVIDFDQITRDPANPQRLSPVVDHGDHLHPGDAGYKVMGDAIDLSLFSK